MDYNTNNSKVFVIINGTRLGDTLVSDVVVQNIKRIFTDSKIIRVTNPELYDGVRYIENTDETIIWNRNTTSKGLFGMLKFAREFPYKNIYAAIPLFGSDRALLLSYMLGAKYILSQPTKSFYKNFFRRSKYKIDYDMNVPMTMQMTNILMGITKEELKSYPIRYNAPDTGLIKFPELQQIRGDYIVFSPVSTTLHKDISLEKTIEILDNITDKNIVLCGVGDVVRKYSDVIKKKNYTNVIDLTNKTGISELAEILHNANASICVDTGVLHLSLAVQTPTIAVYNDSGNSFTPDEKLYNIKILYNNPNVKDILNCLDNFLQIKQGV